MLLTTVILKLGWAAFAAVAGVLLFFLLRGLMLCLRQRGGIYRRPYENLTPAATSPPSYVHPTRQAARGPRVKRVAAQGRRVFCPRPAAAFPSPVVVRC
jgi:hypothetical protein